MVDVPPMHNDFARWYDTVSLGDDEERRKLRWKGVSNAVAEASKVSVEALLRLAYGTQHRPVAAALQAIRDAFKGADAAFGLSGNDRELQVLSGACLVVLMETDEDAGPMAALAATTA
jgi:hypothetical protein